MRYERLTSAALVLALAACSGAASPPALSASPDGAGATRPLVSGPPRDKIEIFVRGNKKRYNPDPIVWQNNALFVAYQNASQPTGSGNSTIVEYRRDGRLLRSVNVPGRCDGMRWNPYTSLMWLTVNEDANSSMYTWDPASGALTHYQFSSAKHGGGYDDLAFNNNIAFIAASNPKLNAKGINKGPAVVSATLAGSVAKVKTVLLGDAEATDIPTGNAVRLNLTDPDSMSVAPNGDIVLVSQADSEIVFIANAGTASQAVSRLLVGTQLDDTVYTTQSNGLFYVADSKKNAIYTVKGKFLADTIYTETPDDSGVAGFIGWIDQSTGTVTPIVTGFKSPTGLIFVPKGG